MSMTASENKLETRAAEVLEQTKGISNLIVLNSLLFFVLVLLMTVYSCETSQETEICNIISIQIMNTGNSTGLFLDLHKLPSADDLPPTVDLALNRCFMDGERRLNIITGRGKKFKSRVLEYLKKHELVDSFKVDELNDGVVVVDVAKRDKSDLD